MNPKHVALTAVFVAAGVMIGYKQFRNTPARSPVNAGAGPRVVLVADLSEAEERCACGDIIRAVRAAQKKGILTEEFTPDSKSELLKRYRILTAPTVLFLDAYGREIARYEGEDERTVAAIRSHLKRMTGQSGS